jgi:hypothetical protein
MLSIPLLAHDGSVRDRKVLSKLKRDRHKIDFSDGCDPAVFAGQIAEYIGGALAKRRDVAARPTPAPITVGAPIEEVAAIEAVATVEEFAPVEEFAAVEEVVPVEEFVPVEAVAAVEEVVPLEEPVTLNTAAVIEDIAPVEAAVVVDVEAEDEALELSDFVGVFVDDLPKAPGLSQPLTAPAPAMSLAPVAVSDDDLDLSPLLDEPAVVIEKQAPMLVADRATVAPRGRVLREEVVAEPAAPAVALVPSQPPAPQSAPTVQVITIPTGNGSHVQASVNVAVAVSVQVAASVNVVVPTPSKRARKPKPMQDEWGFFDPSQCGFPALMAKLDEIAQKEESE